MKRLCLAISISMIVILGLAAMAFAQEATVVDGVEKVIIRAYITGTSPNISAFFEVRNANGTFNKITEGSNPYDASKISVSGSTFDVYDRVCANDGATACTADTDCGQSGTCAPKTYRIHNADLTSSDIGVSIDEETGTVYVFCTKNTSPGWHAMKYTIQNGALVGACGSASGGTFTLKPSDNLCNPGNASSVTGTGTGSDPWIWTCSVAGQTDPPASCSANIKTWKVTPSAGDNGSINPNTAQTVNNGGTKSFSVTANTGYTATVGGCGGSPSTGTGTFTYVTSAVTADCNVQATFALTPINGQCGSASGGTFSTLSSTSANLCSTSGPVINFATTNTGWSWQCQGVNLGNNSSTCTASLQTGTPDIAFLMSNGYVVGVTGATGGDNGAPIYKSITITNYGTGNAGPFTVKMWFIPAEPWSTLATECRFTTSGNILLDTWNVTGLNVGQMLTKTIGGGGPTGAVHTGYSVCIKVDADNQITESNEKNNAYTTPYGFYR